MTELSSEDSRRIGELSANMQNVTSKVESMEGKIDSIDDKLDLYITTCKEFELCKKAHADYQASRADVPQQISNHEQRISRIEEDYYKTTKPQIEKVYAQNDYLKMVLGVLWLVVLALIGLIQQGYLQVHV
jgi:predicted  nucleic acid-binding Zn-ribbon protein